MGKEKVRDRFAAHALQAILTTRQNGGDARYAEEYARKAYIYADAMMKARKGEDDQWLNDDPRG
jgi:hypothetical protein